MGWPTTETQAHAEEAEWHEKAERARREQKVPEVVPCPVCRLAVLTCSNCGNPYTSDPKESQMLPPDLAKEEKREAVLQPASVELKSTIEHRPPFEEEISAMITPVNTAWEDDRHWFEASVHIREEYRDQHINARFPDSEWAAAFCQKVILRHMTHRSGA